MLDWKFSRLRSKIAKLEACRKAYKDELMEFRLESWRKFDNEVGNAKPWGILKKSALGGLWERTAPFTSVKVGKGTTKNLSDTTKAMLADFCPDDDPQEDPVNERVRRQSIRSKMEKRSGNKAEARGQLEFAELEAAVN